MGDKFESGNSEFDSQVDSYKRIDQNTVEVHLKDGTVMTVDNNGDRISTKADIPFQPDMRMESDNVGTSRPDVAPAGLTEDAPGAKTGVDLESLESTQKYLRDQADYLSRLYYAMPGIKEKIDGPASAGAGTSSLGAFEGALQIQQKHNLLYESFRTSIKNTVEKLRDTADALGKIKENYAAAEERNALTAQQWSSIFNDASATQHQV
ncbi:hypothetical protein DFJ67_2087 [Asanoa ferruginea]|uniref:Uncharacterized protein n=1 Tax=Asanoa ferruginea TaxID=53367 RepID=A0A3D9ZGZ0_9ACTN|nr:hypothetical protein [Asanoa ferruginea]REF96119.1 hypothetical protein DFJ67_2087 [Asanoa ferruginea]GIF48019.1 hypothetical protein Afe04nite_25580 [Asanoa ferruginea]